MRCNRFVWAALVAGFALVAVVLLTAKAAPSNQDDSRQVAAATSGLKMSSLFDFDAYKRLFKKSYSGLLENMARFKWYTSRAIRTSISAVKYRFRYDKYHLSINHMSDLSPEELDLMRNKVIERKYNSTRAGRGDDLPEFIPDDDENVVARLRSMIDENAGKPEFKALRAELEQVDTARHKQQSPAGRRKREVELVEEEGPRELPLSKLVNYAPENPDAQLPAETRAKIRAKPKSHNPLYGGIEMATQGLIDQQVGLNKIFFNPPPSQVNMFDEIAKTLDALRRKYLLEADDAAFSGAAPKEEKLPDEVFIDLRKSSSCFLSPRDQGICGSCYAFALTTVAEWLHCHTTGELVALSEQYMVDCGKAYQNEIISGCKGGKVSHANKFFHNFGWELLSKYPYAGVEQQCPYALDTDLKTVGYMRADLRNAVEYHMRAWPVALKKVGPLAVKMNIGFAFDEYGSGVYDGCVPDRPMHAVVLIGHGREDGEDYWLIRNSYSVGWGEGGYMKLSKKADCISPRTGWSWGTDDGINLATKLTKNELNDGEVMKQHYAETMKNILMN